MEGHYPLTPEAVRRWKERITTTVEEPPEELLWMMRREFPEQVATVARYSQSFELIGSLPMKRVPLTQHLVFTVNFGCPGDGWGCLGAIGPTGFTRIAGCVEGLRAILSAEQPALGDEDAGWLAKLLAAAHRREPPSLYNWWTAQRRARPLLESSLGDFAILPTRRSFRRRRC